MTKNTLLLAEIRHAGSSPEGGVTGEDGITPYFADMGRIPLLSCEEERRLAERAVRGDADARHHLIEANLRLVVAVARRYVGNGLPLPDLIQEGNCGLLRAVEGYDPARGRFSTYAVWWIRQSILRALDTHARTIRLPCGVLHHMRKVEDALSTCTQAAGRFPSDADIAEMAHLSPAQVHQARQAMRLAVESLDRPTGAWEDLPLSETVASGTEDDPMVLVVAQAERTDGRQAVRALLACLSEREHHVVRLLFGLDGTPVHTYAEAGRAMGCCKERIRQLKEQALSKLRDAAHRSGMAPESI